MVSGQCSGRDAPRGCGCPSCELDSVGRVRVARRGSCTIVDPLRHADLRYRRRRRRRRREYAGRVICTSAVLGGNGVSSPWLPCEKQRGGTKVQVSLDRSAAASWPPLPASPPPAPAPPLQLLLTPLPPPLPPPWPPPAPPLPLPTPPSSLRSLPLRPRGASPAWGHPVVPAVCRAESAGDPLRHRSACAECACLLRLLIRHRAAAAAGYS